MIVLFLIGLSHNGAKSDFTDIREKDEQLVIVGVDQHGKSSQGLAENFESKFLLFIPG